MTINNIHWLMKRQDELNEAWCKYMGKCSTEILQALAFALRWCDAHPAWISVDDELPPKKSEYDGLSNNVFATDGKEIYESVYNHDFGDWFTHDLWAINNITHWMPLPSIEHFADVSKKTSSSSEKPNNCKKFDMKGYENVIIHEGNAKGYILKGGEQ